MKWGSRSCRGGGGAPHKSQSATSTFEISFPPSLLLQDNLHQFLDHHTNVVHREATPQEWCSEPSTDPRLKRNQHSHRNQDPYRVPPSTLFLNTTSLSRTPATTSTLPRNAPPALLNRTIWSILVSAQPGWSQEQFSNSSHESWKGTGLRATSFRREVVGVCDGVAFITEYLSYRTDVGSQQYRHSLQGSKFTKLAGVFLHGFPSKTGAAITQRLGPLSPPNSLVPGVIWGPLYTGTKSILIHAWEDRFLQKTRLKALCRCSVPRLWLAGQQEAGPMAWWSLRTRYRDLAPQLPKAFSQEIHAKMDL
ncbi:hypothetical protein B0O80DRAFT_510952 [Mortierella sp. GBAus27b]|nr:hypothetical protein B0O80DRAFT_510952 [Mortierella sp. GBAus27b]